MRSFLFHLAAFALFPFALQAQVDSSYNTTYYQQKVSQYRMFQSDDNKAPVMFVGDSITDIAEWNEIFGVSGILNRGISADNTFGVLHRLDDVIRRRPVALYLMIGINDISHDVPDSIIIRNYRNIIKAICSGSPATRIYVQSILPTNNEFIEFKRHQDKIEHIREVNKALKAGEKERLYTYVDLYGYFTDRQGKLDRKYTNDGLHLTAAGYALWKSCLINGKYFR